MLIGTKPVYNSGMEQEEFKAYATDSFQELLDTSPIVDTVMLYNFDLSESKEIQCVIQNNIADTHLKTMERQLLCPIGTLKAGMYIYYHNNYWIVTGRPDNNKMYEKSTLSLCQYKLRWQNKRGEVVSRWCAIKDEYSDGENENKVISLGTDQLSLQVPVDNETINIPRGVKFFIDYNYDEPTVYKLTNPNNVIYMYGKNNGVTNWIVKEVAYLPTVDDLKYGVCNYIPPTDPPIINETTDLSVSITGNQSLKVGFPRTYSVAFKDKDGKEVADAEFVWNIVSKFKDHISSSMTANTIKLQVDDDSYIDESFLLQVIVHGDVFSEKTITVKGMY